MIERIFFVHSSHDDGRISLTDLRRRDKGSGFGPTGTGGPGVNIVDTWLELDRVEDMKLIRQFFSYEHFYVIYCTFWELDTDHDSLLDKDDLLKYDTHALSRKAADRIFSEVPRKFQSGHPGRMCYEDFIYFLLCDQDRHSERALQYWFRIMDMDSDGFLRPWELKHFFDEQSGKFFGGVFVVLVGYGPNFGVAVCPHACCSHRRRDDWWWMMFHVVLKRSRREFVVMNSSSGRGGFIVKMSSL